MYHYKLTYFSPMVEDDVQSTVRSTFRKAVRTAHFAKPSRTPSPLASCRARLVRLAENPATSTGGGANNDHVDLT